jgi:signal peptidase I
MSSEPTVPIEPQRSEQPRLRSHRRLRRDILETVVLIVVVYTLVNLSTVRASLEGPSMQPNFFAGQIIVVNRFAYYFAKPARGDVVVLHSPRDECKMAQPDDTNCEDLIKRVIGLPGELVQINRGRVYINGSLLDEPYVVKGFCETCDGSWKVGPDQYFVLGDNRNNSMDGHSFGPISRDLIVGEAWIRYWPPQDASVIPHPGYTLGSKVLAPPSSTPLPTFTPTPVLEANVGRP